MTCVLKGLYLGGLDDVHDTDLLKEHGVTHILTLDCKPLPIENHETFTYKYVHALDMETTDLLTHFEECIKFIDEGRQKGGVIVHCYVGTSRSSTIVLAYLMQKMDMTLDDSLTLLMKMRPQIRPNLGFKKQLELYEAMGNIVDRTDQHYKMFRLANLARRMQIEKFENSLSEESLSSDPDGQSSNEAVYKCRKCRRALFKNSCLLSHICGKGEIAFDWRGRLSQDSDSDHNTVCNESLFIEPVEWMASHILQLEGKLCCPKCAAKLGSFNWSGERCKCGTWVTPAFHVHTGKVDFSKPRRVDSLQTVPLSAHSLVSVVQEDSHLVMPEKSAVHEGDSDTNEYVSMDQYLPMKNKFPQVTSLTGQTTELKCDDLPPLE